MYSLFILAVFAADFTYTAPKGTWLDYARTGPLSQNRFLIVEQVGNKGDYHLGATQKILDANGHVRYEIPPAQDAWVIKNGILNDEDTYIYQLRGDKTWYLWHPDFGSKRLAFRNSNGAMTQPFNSGETKYFAIKNNGTRLIGLSLVADPNDDQRAVTQIQVLDLKPGNPRENLFSGEIEVREFASARYNQNFGYHFSDTSLYFYDRLKPRFTFLKLDITAPLKNGQITLNPQETDHRIISLTQEAGLLAILAIDQEGTYLSLSEETQEASRGNKTLALLRTQDSDKSGYDAIDDLLQTIGRGFLYKNDLGHISYVKDDILVSFNPKSGTLKHQRLRRSQKGYRTGNSNREILGDHSVFSVRELPARSNKTVGPVIMELNVGNFLPENPKTRT